MTLGSRFQASISIEVEVTLETVVSILSFLQNVGTS